MNHTINKDRLAELIAKVRAEKNSRLEINTPAQSQSQESSNIPVPEHFITTDKYGNVIEYNENQKKFINLAASGQSCVLIGAAGTGKTTCQKGAVQTLIQTGKAGVLNAEGHKHLITGTPGIVICAFTRRAVANIRKNVSDDVKGNCITIHKLLEYEPVYYEVPDDENGGVKMTMRFEPTRNRMNPLPSSIKTLIFEEGSMIGTELHQQVLDACPHNPQIIYLGDIQQLPPVFGPAILGFKLLELPVVELTQVYRQALESPIISLAHRILSGKELYAKDFSEYTKPNQLSIKPWKKKISDLDALMTAGQLFKQLETAGAYVPGEDMILIPFNKAFGTDELNKIIANHLAKKNGDIVHEVIAGFNRLYFREGEKVLYDKEDATIIKIEKNPEYYGAQYQPPSATLDYWGHDSEVHGSSTEDMDDAAVDFVLQQVANASDEDRVKKASHTLTVRLEDSEREVRLSSAGDLNALLLGYALTVHKAQGSEWRKVFFVCHQSHATMLQRELLYTAITRAREELIIICEPETFVKGITSQRVKGNTLAEKAEFFKGKIDRKEYGAK